MSNLGIWVETKKNQIIDLSKFEFISVNKSFYKEYYGKGFPIIGLTEVHGERSHFVGSIEAGKHDIVYSENEEFFDKEWNNILELLKVRRFNKCPKVKKREEIEYEKKRRETIKDPW